jgi:hypothetical protein
VEEKMKFAFVILSLVLAGAAHAEEKNCAVKGMHCDACTEMVKDKVCNDTMAVCDVTVKDGKGKAKMGNIHIKTKEAAGKIDEKAIAKAIADTDYKLEKCTAAKAAM